MHNRAETRLLAGLLMLVGVTACSMSESLAPPVRSADIHPDTHPGISLQMLEEGRHIYLTSCTKCHSPDPVMRHSELDWERILSEMIPKSRLQERQSRNLKAYIGHVLQTTRAVSPLHADEAGGRASLAPANAGHAASQATDK